MADREVLIFWCLKSARLKKSCLSGLGQIGELAPVWLNPSWIPHGLSPEHPQAALASQNITIRSIETPPDTQKQKKTQPDTNRQYCQNRHHCHQNNAFLVTVKAKGYPQLEYILHLFLKIIISAYYNYLQVKIIFLSNWNLCFCCCHHGRWTQTGPHLLWHNVLKGGGSEFFLILQKLMN